MNVFKQALTNIWRDKGISFAAILVTTLTFLITTVFVFIALGSHVALDYLESRAQLTAFFKAETEEVDILELRDKLQESDSVVEVTYTSKEQALEIYRQDYRDEPALLESISANIFPASLDVRAENIESLDSVSQVLQNNDMVEEVVYFQDVAQGFKQVSDTVRNVSLVLVGIFAAVSLFIILLAIGMSIYNKKEEIEIMRLIGAGKWYIRTPFLLQGALYGIVAVILSLAIVVGAGVFLFPRVEPLFRDIPLPEITPLLAAQVVGGELAAAALLGIIAAFFSTRKYLKT